MGGTNSIVYDFVDHEGLFETKEQTLQLAGKVDIGVRSLRNDWVLWAKHKWGPAGFGASVTADKLQEFQRDVARFRPFNEWANQWDAYYANLLTMSWWNPWSNYFREVRRYAQELSVWRELYTSATGKQPSAAPVVIPSPLPGVIPEGKGGSKDEFSDWLDKAVSIAKWGVLGVGIFYGGSLLLKLKK